MDNPNEYKFLFHQKGVYEGKPNYLALEEITGMSRKTVKYYTEEGSRKKHLTTSKNYYYRNKEKISKRRKERYKEDSNE